MIHWPRSLIMIYKVRQTPYRLTLIKSFYLFQGNPQSNDQILTLEIALHDRNNNFNAPVTPRKGPATKKTNIITETDTTTVML